MDEIILVGAGGHARSCIDVIELLGQYKIAGLVEKDEKYGHENLDYPILGIDDDLSEMRKKYCLALVTLGQIKTPAIRIRLFQRLQELNYQFPVIVSPRAHVSKHAQIGMGTIILHDAIVNANAKVGKNCIINNKALIEHDAIVGDHCHISTGAILNGDVTVGTGSFIGSGSVIKQGIAIEKSCLVGMGLTVRHNLSNDSRFTDHDKT